MFGLRPQVLVTCIDIPVDAGPEVWLLYVLCSKWVWVLCVCVLWRLESNSMQFIDGMSHQESVLYPLFCACTVGEVVNACLQPPLNDFRELMYHVAQPNLLREPVKKMQLTLLAILGKAGGTVCLAALQGWYVVHSSSLQCATSLPSSSMRAVFRVKIHMEISRDRMKMHLHLPRKIVSFE